MGLFGKKKNKAAQPVRTRASRKANLPATYKFDVAGFYYYEDGMYKVLTPNPNYKNPKSTARPVYKYRYFEELCDLVPEPDNEYDPNAILVGYKGVKLGHVPRTDTTDVRLFLANGYIAKLRISPGHYKVYEDDEWVTYKKDPYAEVTLFRP